MPGAVPSLYASVHLIFMAVKYSSMINSIFGGGSWGSRKLVRAQLMSDQKEK